MRCTSPSTVSSRPATTGADMRDVGAVLAHMTAAVSIPCLAIVSVAQAAPRSHEKLIRRVAVDRSSANVSAGEPVTLTVATARTTRLNVEVLDRDGFVVRTLIDAGGNTFVWNGRDEAGQIVPDEAYSFRIVAAGGADEYFPATRAGTMS